MKEEIYPLIWNLCEVKNRGTCLENGRTIPPRAAWIVRTLEMLGIRYELDPWEEGGTLCWNVYVSGRGQSPLALMAHHDIVNPRSDNANDNSASIINLIALKLLRPEVELIFTDGEEVGGWGARRWAGLVQEGLRSRPEWVLNLELTGKGGESFFIGDDKEGPLKGYLVGEHGAATLRVPFNDSVVLRREGIDSCVINPLPIDENGRFETWRLARCHSLQDTVDEVSTEDMRLFVERVLVPIVDRWPKSSRLSRSLAKIKKFFGFFSQI